VVSRLFPVALARGKHLFPFRTEQLSPSAPMVLGSQGPGRVGRRRFFVRHGPPAGGPSSWARGRRVRCCGSDKDRHVATTPVGPDDADRNARAAVHDADGLSGRARSHRPPSRRRSRPRAAGTSGSAGAHRACAARALRFAVMGTSVRKIGPPPDGQQANVCAYRCGPRKMALQSQPAAPSPATRLAGPTVLRTVRRPCDVHHRLAPRYPPAALLHGACRPKQGRGRPART
jgi:hypothetical protein